MVYSNQPLVLECPACKSRMKSSAFRAELGSKGRTICPVCSASLRLSPPYPIIALLGTFPILYFFVVTRGVNEGLFSLIRMLFIRFLGSVVLSVYLSRFKPPVLKLSPPDKDAVIELFKQEPK